LIEESEIVVSAYGGRIGIGLAEWLRASGIRARYQRSEYFLGPPGPFPPEVLKHLIVVVMERFLLPVVAYLVGRYLYEHSPLKYSKQEIPDPVPLSLEIYEPSGKHRIFIGSTEEVIRKLNDAYRVYRRVRKFCSVCGNYEPLDSKYCCKCGSSTFFLW